MLLHGSRKYYARSHNVTVDLCIKICKNELAKKTALWRCLEQQVTKGHLLQLVALSNRSVDVPCGGHSLCYKACVAVAFEASARLSLLLLFIVSSTIRSPYDCTRTFTRLCHNCVRMRYKIVWFAREYEREQCTSAFR